jgi:hypothetical protein
LPPDRVFQKRKRVIERFYGRPFTYREVSPHINKLVMLNSYHPDPSPLILYNNSFSIMGRKKPKIIFLHNATYLKWVVPDILGVVSKSSTQNQMGSFS